MTELLLNEEVQQWLQLHEKDDPAAVLLKGSPFPDISAQFLASQITGRQKAKLKLPEWYHTPGIIYPQGISLEQCSSELTAKYKASLVGGFRMADLTGGMGVDAWYLSRQFTEATYVEPQEELCAIANHNFQQLQGKPPGILNLTAEGWLKEQKGEVDFLYLDPSRRSEGKKLYRLEDTLPDVVSLWPALRHAGKQIMVKAACLQDISRALILLPEIKNVYVVAVQNECKEILLLSGNDAQVKITAINLLNEYQSQTFRFFPADEPEALTKYSPPKAFLFEPNVAILKAGGFRSVAAAYNLNKLHPNSHLYTSTQMVHNFPGRTFEIKAVTNLQKKYIKTYIPEMKANITIRNFPLSVNEIKKKTGLKDGGDTYLFATTNTDGKKIAIICRKTDGERPVKKNR